MKYIYAHPFESISDFKWSMKTGGEVEFEWKGKDYSILRVADGILFTEQYKPETAVTMQDIEQILDCTIDGQKLREIITKVNVIFRFI